MTSDYVETINRREKYDPRRNSVAEFGHHHHHDVVDHMSQIGRPRSKAGSHLSVPASRASRRGPSVIRTDYLHREDDVGPSFLYPHLQALELGIWPHHVKSKCFDSKQHLLINNVSFEARGGEIVAIMATSEEEGTALLNVLAGKKSPAVGDIFLNGQHISSNQLRSRVGFAQNNSHLCKEMTALQTLRFHYDLKKPTGKLQHLKIDAMDRVSFQHYLFSSRNYQTVFR